MNPRGRAAPPGGALQLPAVFRVGQHSLATTHVAAGRWTVSLDGGPVSQFYGSQVEAWEAGVRLADEQDRSRGS
ncbi:MAG: hypothetical protein NDI82_13785 [Anaeromyxobacteraceae bacterium]|nr:hypothetical protein [Anaeromyxobacteraceae bacterium]